MRHINTQKVVEDVKISYTGMDLVNLSQKRTIIAQPLEHGIKDIDCYSILKKRVTILKKVSDFRCFVGIATDQKGLLMGTF